MGKPTPQSSIYIINQAHISLIFTLHITNYRHKRVYGGEIFCGPSGVILRIFSNININHYRFRHGFSREK